jgi:GxxExxY protein
MTEILFKDESYKIVGLCMEVHRELGHGFKEAVYKDALEYELQMACIAYQREKEFKIPYKDTILKRRYNADFIVFGEIIIEAKASSMIVRSYLTNAICQW